jgi:hypothetical protein
LGSPRGFQYQKKPYPSDSSEVFSASIGKSFNLGENVSIEIVIAGGKMGGSQKKTIRISL